MQVLINVDVDDLGKATQFHQAAFGLKVGRRFGGDGIELLGNSAPIYLLAKAAGSSATGLPARILKVPLPRAPGVSWH